MLRTLAAAMIALSLAGCATGDHALPSNNRNWVAPDSRLVTVTWSSADRFTMANLRDWDWGPRGVVAKRWHTRSYDVGDTQAIWYFVDPFPHVPALAHTFATFELGRGSRRSFLTVSVEAREEVGESYNPVLGLFGKYELIFAWSTEKDILTDTVVHLGHQLRAYRINVTPDQAATILRGFLARTNELARKPEFYSTVGRNCTTELAAVVNREFDKAIPPSPAFVFTGKAAAYLHSLGYLGDPQTSFAVLRAEADISAPVKAAAGLPEPQFSIAIRRRAGSPLRPPRGARRRDGMAATRIRPCCSAPRGRGSIRRKPLHQPCNRAVIGLYAGKFLVALTKSGSTRSRSFLLPARPHSF